MGECWKMDAGEWKGDRWKFDLFDFSGVVRGETVFNTKRRQGFSFDFVISLGTTSLPMLPQYYHIWHSGSHLQTAIEEVATRTQRNYNSIPYLFLLLVLRLWSSLPWFPVGSFFLLAQPYPRGLIK